MGKTDKMCVWRSDEKYVGYEKSNIWILAIVQLWDLTGGWYPKMHLAFYKLTRRLVEMNKFFSLVLSNRTKTKLENYEYL